MVSETTAMVLAEGQHTMALDQSALLEVLEALKAAEVDDRIRQAAETIYQALIEAGLSSVIGALPHERTDARTAHRNGHRQRLLASTAGDLELRIPKLRSGSFFPSLLERRRRVDQSLFAVIMEAYLHGTSTRKVDDLVKALGADSGISKSEVSRICADLDTEVAAFRDRGLSAQRFPYVFLDATYCKARVDHRVVSQAVVVATGVAADGHREVLGFEVGDSEDGAFWTALLRRRAGSRCGRWVSVNRTKTRSGQCGHRGRGDVERTGRPVPVLIALRLPGPAGHVQSLPRRPDRGVPRPHRGHRQPARSGTSLAPRLLTQRRLPGARQPACAVCGATCAYRGARRTVPAPAGFLRRRRARARVRR
jgi:hypothetical protein